MPTDEDRRASSPTAGTAPGILAALRLLWGRPRRLFLNVFRPAYVRDSLARRAGECRRCGVCCRMGLRCRFLRYDGALAACERYGRYRTPNCRTFPIDERDLADRDLVDPVHACGYTFRPRAGR